jgi:ATPase family associated with various cellular activities (AAA)
MNQVNAMNQSLKSEFSVISPKGKLRRNFHVPPDFADRIMLHIVKNTLDYLEAPLMLAIQGPKGEGKSKMAREICSLIGVYVVALPGATLSGIYEKEPILILRDAYLHASALRNIKNQLVVLLIDDLDTSIAATYAERRYTVNTQLLNGTLMSLCDDPYHIGEQDTYRIPMIVTGNDFTSLHEPLTRHGRAQFYDWKPDITVKTEIVRHMFEGYVSDNELERISQLVQHFSTEPPEPIAFYQVLRNNIYDDIILTDIHTRKTIDIACLNSLIANSRALSSIGELIRLGEQQRNNKPHSYNRES